MASPAGKAEVSLRKLLLLPNSDLRSTADLLQL